MAQYTCLTTRLNIRRGPSKTEPIIGVLKRGARVRAKVRVTTHASTSEPNTNGEPTREGSRFIARQFVQVGMVHVLVHTCIHMDMDMHAHTCDMDMDMHAHTCT